MNDCKIAFRQLARSLGFTTVTVLTLAIGMALVACAFATVNAYLIQSLPYLNAERVHHVMYAPPGPYEPRGMSAIDWTGLTDVVEDTINSSGATFYLMEDGAVRTTKTLQVSPGFMRGLGVRAMVGRTFLEEEFAVGAEMVGMISHELWRDRFGLDPAIVGKSFEVSLEETGVTNGMVRIVGVLPAGFWFGRDSSAKMDILTPWRTRHGLSRTYMIRLRAGAPVKYAEARITEAARKVGSDFRPGWTGVHLESMHDRYVKEIRPILVGVTIATGVVLVLACANVAALVLLRGLQRQKEMAVRVALGAGRKHILRLLAWETCLLCGGAFAGGLLLSDMGLNWLAPQIESQLGKAAPAGPSQISIDSPTIMTIGLVSLVIALSLAFIPLLAPWQRRVMDALRSQGTRAMEGPSMRRLRAGLIGLQVAGSLVLLTGCGLMIRSVINLANTDLGFNAERVFRVGVRLPARTYNNPEALNRFFEGLIARLDGPSDGRMTLMSAFPPFYPANAHAFESDKSESEQNSAGLMRVGAGYFDLYGTELKQGREFTTADRLTSEPVAMVSETLARRLWPEGTATGQRIRVAEGDMPGAEFGQWRTVVGVVRDIRQGYEDSDLRDIYIPFLQAPTRFSSIHVRTAQPASFWQQKIRSAAAELDAYAQVGTVTAIQDEDIRRMRAQFLAAMLTGFAVFTAFLAMLGIYGVTRYAAQQKERDIAIHIALGAPRNVVVATFLKEGGRVLAGGVAAGLLGAWAVTKFLQGVVYGVAAFDIGTTAGVSLLLIVAGLCAIWLPAYRAAQRDPMMVLKEG
jgi:putative ABC transport system permease protein